MNGQPLVSVQLGRDPIMSIFFRQVVHRYTAPGGSAFQFALNQPTWISRFAIAIFAFILVLPLIILIVLALLAALFVFGTLAIVNAVVSLIRSILGLDPAPSFAGPDVVVEQVDLRRRNVRVIGPSAPLDPSERQAGHE